MFRPALLTLILMAPLTAAAQVVSTLVNPIDASGGVAVGPGGDIYVADFGDYLNDPNGTTVYRVTQQGDVSVFATGFSGASGNEFDGDGNLIQANISASRIDQVSPEGVRTTLASIGFEGPVGVAVAANGDIFVANCGGDSISQIISGVVTTFVSDSGLSCPNGLTLDPDGNVYAVNFNDGNIFKITPQGEIALLATTPGTAFRPGSGNGHIVYGNGRLYLTSNATSQVFELTLDGQLSVLAGSGVQGNQDGPADQATFSFPNGIAISQDGRFLYVNSSEHTATGTLNAPTFPLNPSLLRVIDLAPSVTINAGFNDAWYNPATPGQGFFVTVFPEIEKVFVAWFTFDTERPAPDVIATLGEPGHRWLTAFGSYAGDTATLAIEVSSGGIFDASPPLVDQMAGGTLTVEFSDCENGLMTYDIPSISKQGEIPIQRIALDNVAFCESLSLP